MAKFTKKNKKSVGAVSTASLPDIVFMILFFFMVATVMRDKEPLVEIKLPKATEVEKIKNKTRAAFLSVGPPVDKKRGTDPVLQLNDDIAEVGDIRQWVEDVKAEKDEADRNRMTWVLNVDKETKMGRISAIKQELRKASALKIMYQSTEDVKVSGN